MEIEHNKENLAIHLDTYIQETLAEYKATVTKFEAGADAARDYVGT